MNGDMLFKDEGYQITGACFEVHNHMGCGFLEAVYQECLELEFSEKRIPFVAQPNLKLKYKKYALKKHYVPDFLCYDKIVVEIKTEKKLENIDHAQIINYLKATRLELGILVNFGHYPKLEIERFVNTKHK
ncbi:MAG: GxxExxY protein [Kiritimatiellia bacterium]